MQPPSLVGTPIQVNLTAGGNDAEVICFFAGTGGDPEISIADGGTTTNYVRQGSSLSGTHIPTGGFANYVIHADPSLPKTVYITVTYTGSTSFTNLYDGPGMGAYISTMYETSGTMASLSIGDASIF
ncbi:MAG TPA: hypothetical protein VFD13_09760 [Candidatus Kapabacteria bacterium]|nr:hypothetical protein [Candidatus Kapabacteria bacterium]